MSQLAIDPIGYSEALQKAGMPKEQADLIAKTQEAKIDKLIEVRELATKADLRELEMRLAARINETQINMLKWMFSMFVGFGAMLIASMAWLMPR